MLDAAKRLASVIEEGYEPWACEKIGTVEVDVLLWVRDHAPEWLD